MTSSIAIRLRLALALAAALLPAACGVAYQPGVDGSRRTLPQNASSNSQPQPAGSLPR